MKYQCVYCNRIFKVRNVLHKCKGTLRKHNRKMIPICDHNQGFCNGFCMTKVGIKTMAISDSFAGTQLYGARKVDKEWADSDADK